MIQALSADIAGDPVCIAVFGIVPAIYLNRLASLN